MRRLSVTGLILANALAAGIGVRAIVDTTHSAHDPSKRLLAKVAMEVRRELKTSPSSGTILAIYNSICSTCNSGATLDSLIAYFHEPKINVIIVLMDDYSQLDLKNFKALWRMPFQTELKRGASGRLLAKIKRNEFFVYLPPQGAGGAQYFTSVVSLLKGML